MATKANILSNINTKLASESGITAQEHREALASDNESVLNEFYKTDVISDTHLTTNVFTDSGLLSSYSLTIKKQGGYVIVNGFLSNSSGSGIVPFGTPIMTITNSEFFNSNEVQFMIFSALDASETVGMALRDDNALVFTSPILENESFRLTFTYFTGQ